jgi:rhomboid family GlyGly-CTERM serine protease
LSGPEPPPRLRLPGKPPWLFIAATALALVIQCNPAWRERLIYDRDALAHGQLWRVWTGHWVHFGWPHFVPDTGLFLIVGWLLEARHALFARLAVFLMPAVISAAIYWFDPGMLRYGGLSAVDLGLLLYLAAQGWQRKWSDWFWPAVLVIYLVEIVLEARHGGQGGGTIPFDEPGIRIATGAHVAGAAYALLACLAAWLTGKWRQRSV